MKWQPISTAPKDGTDILVLETPNGEHFNVMVAAYFNYGAGDPRLGENPNGSKRFWGVIPTRWSGDGGDCTLPVRWQPIACTPIAWKPLPKKPSRKKIEYFYENTNPDEIHKEDINE